MSKTRNDFVRVGARTDAVSVCGPNYEYHFKPGEPGLELPRAAWASSVFDAVRDRLEVTEDPVIVPDSTAKARADSPKRGN